MALVLAACTQSAPATDAGPVDTASAPAPAARAAAALQLDVPLPPRARVVALSNQLSIAASEQPSLRAEYLSLAARLRERLWRFDRRDTDLREAVELYQQLAKHARGTALGCAADRRRWLLSAESQADAAQLYREVFLAVERQDAAASSDDDRNACFMPLQRALDQLRSFRPSGLRWQQLRAAAAAQRSAAGAAAAASGVVSASASASVPPQLSAGKVRDIVVQPPADMLAKNGAVLTAAQPYSWERGGRVVLSLSAPAGYRLGRLAPDAAAGRGHRLYIDMPNVRMNKRMRDVTTGGLIRALRFGKRKGGTRVVLDLAASAYRRVFYLPKPFRVVIDVGMRQASRAPAPAPQGTAKPLRPASQRAVARITLDPGHGGWDSGAVGPTGLREKDVALDIAHRAAPALANELGIETMLSRDTDVYVPLEERTARANAFQSDLFISIHCNATDNGSAHGVEIYVLDPNREIDPLTADLMARENRGGHKLPAAGLGARVATIAAGLDVGDNARRSHTLAELLRRATLASTSARYPGMRDHGVKTAGFFVLLGSEMPAALFETAFISNPDDEVRLATADFRQKLADAIVNAVKAYRDGL